MKLIFTILMLVCFKLSANQDVVDLTISILQSEDSTVTSSTYFQADKVDLFRNRLSKHGAITRFKCAKNHDSKIFDTVACYVSYENLPSGIVWEFYYFFDKDKWIGTNLGIVSVIPITHCVNNIHFKNQLGQGISYDRVEC